MKRMEAYYRFRLARRLDAPPVITITPAKTDNPTSKADRKVQMQTPAIDDRKPSSAKGCAGHLGAQLGAIRKDGSSYECVSEKKKRHSEYVTFTGRHINRA